MLFAGRALAGVLSSATMASAMAYVSDSTSDLDRGGGIGTLGAAGGLGVILGPGFGGWLGAMSLSAPFYLSAVLSALTMVLAALFLPESLPRERRQEGAGHAKIVNVGELWSALSSATGFLLFMVFLASFGLANFEAVFGLYALERFGYGPSRVGVILTVVGVASTAGKVCTGALTRRWGDVLVIKASLLAGSAAFLVLLAVNTYVTVLMATGLFVLSKTFLRPSALALISKRATTGQGTAMGLGNSFISLGRIVGPIWAGLAFDVNVTYPYLSGSVVLFVGFLLSLTLLTSSIEAQDHGLGSAIS